MIEVIDVIEASLFYVRIYLQRQETNNIALFRGRHLDLPLHEASRLREGSRQGAVLALSGRS